MNRELFIQTFRDVRRFLVLGEISPRAWVFSSSLLAVASLLEGASLGMLIPLIDIAVRHGNQAVPLNDFPLLKHIPVPEHIRTRHLFLILMGIVFCFLIAKNLCLYFSETLASIQSRKVEHKLRVKIFSRYLSFGKAFFDNAKVGHLSDIVRDQVMNCTEMLHFINSIILESFLLIVYMGIMAAISWKLMICALAFLPPSYLIVMYISKKLSVSTQSKFRIDQRAAAYLQDILSNIVLIKTCCTEDRETASFAAISHESRQNAHSIRKKVVATPLSQEVVLTFMIMLLILLSLFLFFMTGATDGGIASFFAFFIVLRRFSLCLNQIGLNYVQISCSFAPIQKILWVFSNEDKHILPNGSQTFPGLKHDIRFVNAHFGYSSGTSVLNGINLTIRRNQFTALVGATGAGKSTLVGLLLRYYDLLGGQILYDGTDIREFDTASLLSKIAVVDQGASIFNMSIRENILYGCTQRITNEALDQICRQAAIYDFVQQLPNKYETIVGDRGVRLSGGERQRLAIARAILKDPDIFIFDEATSSLDMSTEQQVQAAIERLSAGRTVIAIAHRLSTVLKADRVVVVEDGRVTQEGSPAELQAGEGPFRVYWNILKAQTEHVENREDG